MKNPNIASSSRTDMGYLKTLLSEQRHALVSAQTLESDLNIAFDLQLQEAITASLALQPSPSSSPPPPEPSLVVGDDDDEGLSFSALTAEEVDRLEQELKDREMRKMRNNLNRRIHNQKVASDMLRVPEDEWEKSGDYYQKAYGEGSASEVAADENFTVYIKGLVSEERVKDSTVSVAAIGVAICDSKDNLIFVLRKPLIDGEKKSLMSGIEVGMEALVEGINAAYCFGFEEGLLFL